MVFLPESIKNLSLQGGQFLMQADTAGKRADTEDALKQSVEQIAGGQGHVVRNGQIVLVDRAGRYWVRPQSRDKILCFDGKNWTDHSAMPDGVHPTTQPRKVTPHSLFSDIAWQDSAGNVQFVAGDQYSFGMGVFRCTPQGEWSFQLISQPHEKNDLLTLQPALIAQSNNSRATILSSFLIEANAPVIYYDGTAWQEFNARVCPFASHKIKAIIPFPDGTIGSLCSGNRLDISRPGVTANKDEVMKLVDQLTDSDFEKREAASRALVEMGPPIATILIDLPKDQMMPEAQVRLEDILKTIESGKDGKHDEQILYGGRFKFATCEVASRRSDGTVRLFATNCLDTRTKITTRFALLSIAADGKWSMQQIPMKQWREAGVQKPPVECFEDSKGHLWLPEGLCTDDKLEAHPAMPDGLTFNKILGQDAAGRLFMQTDKYFIFDPSVPADTSQAHVDAFDHLVRVSAMSGSNVGWGDDLSQWPEALVRIDSTGPHRIEPTWNSSNISSVIPINDGAIIQRLPAPDEKNKATAMFWDGKAWTSADNLWDLVLNNADALAPKIDSHLAVIRPFANYTLKLAAGSNHIWMEAIKLDQNQQASSYFRFYDGKDWHSVWDEVGFTAAAVDTAADGGTTILADVPMTEVRWLYYDGQQVRSEKLDLPKGLQGIDEDIPPVEGSDHAAWLPQTVSRGNVWRYKDGKITRIDGHCTPIFADSQSRLWALDEDRPELCLHVDDTTWATCSIDGLDRIARMIESPDHRLWLLHTKGLSQIEVEQHDGGTTIREAGRWTWDTPKNSFRRLFADDGGGLWFAGTGSRECRVILPSPQQPR